MQLVHDFAVPVPADQAWDLLVDVRRIAPCLPGAAVTSVDGDAFEGGMKIKLGPIAMTFKGDGEIVEQDRAAGRAVIEARGRDAKGNGGAQATVTATLDERGGETHVHVVTDLNVTGKAAQFGGGVMKDVSNRMLATFAGNLAQLIEAGGGEPGPGGPATSPGSSSTGSSSTGSSSTASSSTRPSSSAASSAGSFVPAGDDGLDAMGLLLGSDVVKNVVRPVLLVTAGLALGFLYGKNRTLERIVRGAF